MQSFLSSGDFPSLMRAASALLIIDPVNSFSN
jgi:hypothetical protein